MDKVMKGKSWFWLLLFVILAGSNMSVLLAKSETVQIWDRGTHYKVNINFSKKPCHWEVGVEYGKQLRKQMPKFEALVDSYLAEITGNDYGYRIMLGRAKDIEPQVSREYLDEISGLGKTICSTMEAIRGDNKLSPDELLLYNLVPDVARGTQCSAVGVFGSRSASRKTIMARVLDFYTGSQNQLPKLQAVTYITYNTKNDTQSICLIGFLGYFGVISGLNGQVFAAILDSTSGAAYSSQGKRSYPMDLRFALENKDHLHEVAGYMSESVKNYSYNHLIALADSWGFHVLENNISGTGSDIHRALRNDCSPLNDGITWGIRDAVACVNSFVLKGNHDNHTINPNNMARWAKIKELLAAQDVFTRADLKKLISYHYGPEPGSQLNGDLYNVNTQQIVIYEPDSLSLEVFFRPKNTKLPVEPLFETVSVFSCDN
jgi:hypothetical protein